MQAIIKRIFFHTFFIAIVLALFHYQEPIQRQVSRLISAIRPINNGEVNKYYTGADYKFVQSTRNFSPNNFQELLNLYYHILDGGYETFQFFCPESYRNCLDDVYRISNSDGLLSDINSFVHPFNTFHYFKTEINSNGRVTINIKPNYTEEQIKKINQRVDEIEAKLINDDLTKRQKIRRVHDYIINITRYDKQRADYGDSDYLSNIAYGPLFQGKGICGGYTDAMAIFLHRWNIPNIRVTSEMHIWNLVYLDGRWLHLDLTFNDPVTESGEDILSHKYFLLTTRQLKSLEVTEHDFDEEVFPEALMN